MMEKLFILIIVIFLAVLFLTVGKGIANKKLAISAFWGGLYGERSVAQLLRSLDSRKYKVYNDILIKTSSGTGQIDHIVVSPYGIFVIETKHFTGLVTGHDDWASWYWSQKSEKKKIYSPVLQDLRHVDILSSITGIDKKLFIPVVVFTGKAHIHIDTCHAVLFSGQLIPFIKLFRNETLSSVHTEKCCKIIEKRNITDKRIRENHISYVNEIRKHYGR